MATFTKHSFSEIGADASISVSAQPTTIHETSSDPAIIDEIWVYASNKTSNDAVLTINAGQLFGAKELLKITIPGNAGLVLVIPGLLLRGGGQFGAIMEALASVDNALEISGYINRIS